MKKSDIIVVGSIVIVALILSLFTIGPKYLFPKDRNKYISVQINGEEVEQINWPKDNSTKETRYQAIGGYNIIKVHDKSVEISESDCPDQICVHNAPIKEVGEMIVCLPHRFIVEIKEDNRTNDLDIMLR